MFLTGLLSLDPAGANPALPVAISAKAGTDSIAPATPTDDPSVAASPAHEFLSLLGMLLEDDNPPAAFSAPAEAAPPAGGAATTAPNEKRKKDASSDPESGGEWNHLPSLAPLPAPVPDSLSLSVPVPELPGETAVPGVEIAAPAVEAEAPAVETVTPVVGTMAPAVETVAPVVGTMAPAVEITIPVSEQTPPVIPALRVQAVETLPAIQGVEPATEVAEPVMGAERPRTREDFAAAPVEAEPEPHRAVEPVSPAPLPEAAPVSSPAVKTAAAPELRIQKDPVVSPEGTAAPAGRPREGAPLTAEAAAGQTAPVEAFVRPVTTPAAELAFAVRLSPAPRADRLEPTLRFRDTLSAARPAVEPGSVEMDAPALEEAAPVAASPAVERAFPATSTGIEPLEKEAAVAAPASGSAPEASRPVRRTSPEIPKTAGTEQARSIRRAPAESESRAARQDTPAAESAPLFERRARPTAPAAVSSPHGTAPAEDSGGAVAVTGSPAQTVAPPEKAQPAAVSTAAAPELTAPESEPLKPPTEPVRQVSLEISAPDSNRRVTVQMVEGEDGLHVSVRSDDSDLTASLRHEIGDLVSRLENSGFDTDTWSQDSGSQPDSPQRDTQPDSGAGQRDRRRQPAWVDELQPRRPNLAEESFTWHLQSATGTT